MQRLSIEFQNNEGQETSPVFHLLLCAVTMHKFVRRSCLSRPLFRHIQEAFDHFLDGSSGLLQRIQKKRSWFERLVREQEVEAPCIDEHCVESALEIEILADSLRNIVNVSIYDILDAFDAQLDCAEFWKYSSFSMGVYNLPMLQIIASQVRKKPMRIVKSLPEVISDQSKEVSPAFYYQARLDSINGQIRVLHILPAADDEPLRCRLEERNLRQEGLREALSYVWGKPGGVQDIWIDKYSFPVTQNLHKALHGLRLANSVRTIWVDAICINQLDLVEKTEQIRLMRDIYSTAETVVIWLGGGSPTNIDLGAHIQDAIYAEHAKSIAFLQPYLNTQAASQGSSFNFDNSFQPPKINPLVQAEISGMMIGEYDLARQLNEARKVLESQDSWTVRQLAFVQILARSCCAIFDEEWWERVWTIQEAFLGQHFPMIYFKGYIFTWRDLDSALTLFRQIQRNRHFRDMLWSSYEDSEKDEWSDKDDQMHQIRNCVAGGIDRLWENEHKGDMLLDLRKNLGNIEESQVPESLSSLLCKSVDYCATDPRDKIFALEGLRPRHLGCLLAVDYQRSLEEVLTRATAQCLNEQRGLSNLLLYRKFLVERTSTPSSAVHPSWTIDFTPSRNKATFDNSIDERGFSRLTKTLEGLLSLNTTRWLTKAGTDIYCVLLATPTVLFCEGFCLDRISRIGKIPPLVSINQNSRLAFLEFLNGLSKEANSHLAFSNTTTKPLENGLDRQGNITPDVSASDKEATGNNPGRLETIHRIIKSCDIQELFAFDPSSQSGLAGVDWNGECYFITELGLIGISTAPVDVGDFVSIIRGISTLLVLRQVINEHGLPQTAEKHRIVSRVILGGMMNGEAADLLDSAISPDRPFQIV